MSADTPILSDEQIRRAFKHRELADDEMDALRGLLAVLRPSALAPSPSAQKCARCGKILTGTYPVPVICESCHSSPSALAVETLAGPMEWLIHTTTAVVAARREYERCHETARAGLEPDYATPNTKLREAEDSFRACVMNRDGQEAIAALLTSHSRLTTALREREEDRDEQARQAMARYRELEAMGDQLAEAREALRVAGADRREALRHVESSNEECRRLAATLSRSPADG